MNITTGGRGLAARPPGAVAGRRPRGHQQALRHAHRRAERQGNTTTTTTTTTTNNNTNTDNNDDIYNNKHNSDDTIYIYIYIYIIDEYTHSV